MSVEPGKPGPGPGEGWPLSDTGEGALGPHARMTLDPSNANAVQTFRLEGT